mmetsp:Transcript_9370/g.19453  ORF Transcript_9370/g.19453 Transcript_9370/m.19453 type:complete len:109 (-) Transcript_9370:2306-2632(-)
MSPNLKARPAKLAATMMEKSPSPIRRPKVSEERIYGLDPEDVEWPPIVVLERKMKQARNDPVWPALKRMASTESPVDDPAGPHLVLIIPTYHFGTDNKEIGDRKKLSI